MLQEYAPILRLVLIPVGAVIAGFLLEKWIRKIVDLMRKIEDAVIAFNKASVLMLALYLVVLAYVKLG